MPEDQKVLMSAVRFLLRQIMYSRGETASLRALMLEKGMISQKEANSLAEASREIAAAQLDSVDWSSESSLLELFQPSSGDFGAWK
jgi:hypothetical protein